MIALYIILGIIILVALLVILSVGIDFKYSADGLFVRIIAGPLKILVIPSEKKKTDYKKLSRKLKNKKISEASFTEEKKEKKPEKPAKKLKFGRTGEAVNDLISAISEMSDDPEALRFLLVSIKKLAENFKKSLRVRITSLKASIDAGDAAKSCIACGALSQFVSYFLEFLGNYTNLKELKENSVSIAPAFDMSGYNFDISFSLKTRIFHLLKALISSFIENAKIQKQYLPEKKGIKK